MKSSFSGYYSPNTSEYEIIWKEATIVLDTNVLLNFYRLPTSTLNEFLDVLELLKERLWIPHQVALEFQRNRLGVIAAERKSTEEALASAQAVVGDLKKKVDALQIEKRGLGIETQPILDDLQRANEKLVAAIEAAHMSQLEIASSDPVRDRLDALLDSRVGPGPKSQIELDELIKEGEDRFRDRIPPGFADADKGKNPNEASFIHDHLRYQRKFGDLILWRQILEYAKKSSLKKVLLVTADKKEDWWWREQGKTMGPHAELVSEIKRKSDVELFWMYSSVQFLEHASKYTTAKVSDQAVKELEEVVLSFDELERMKAPWGREDDLRFSNYRKLRKSMTYMRRGSSVLSVMPIIKWISKSYGEVNINEGGFPEFQVCQGERTLGFSIFHLNNTGFVHFPNNIFDMLEDGSYEVIEGILASYTIVLSMSESNFYELLESNGVFSINRSIERALIKFPAISIVFGAVLKGEFVVIPRLSDEDNRGSSDLSSGKASGDLNNPF